MQRMAARGLGVEEALELNALVLAFAEEASGEGWCIEVQRSIEFDEQDRELGMDTYCLVAGGATHYGGVKAWTVRANALCLSLDESAALELGLETTLEIEFPTEHAPVVNEMLRRILDGAVAE